MRHCRLFATAVLSAAFAPLLASAAAPERLIAIEAKIFKVHDKAYREMKLDDIEKNKKWFDAEAQEAFLKTFRDQKAKYGVDVVMAPRVLVADGQAACVKIGQPREYVTGFIVEADQNGTVVWKPRKETRDIGFTLQVTPHISADRKFIRIECEHSECHCQRHAQNPCANTDTDDL